METKTRALFELIMGVVLLMVAVGFGVYIAGHHSNYQLFDKSAIDELLKWGFMALGFGLISGASITRAYYILKSGS